MSKLNLQPQPPLHPQHGKSTCLPQAWMSKVCLKFSMSQKNSWFSCPHQNPLLCNPPHPRNGHTILLIARAQKQCPHPWLLFPSRLTSTLLANLSICLQTHPESDHFPGFPPLSVSPYPVPKVPDISAWIASVASEEAFLPPAPTMVCSSPAPAQNPLTASILE